MEDPIILTEEPIIKETINMDTNIMVKGIRGVEDGLNIDMRISVTTVIKLGVHHQHITGAHHIKSMITMQEAPYQLIIDLNH